MAQRKRKNTDQENSRRPLHEKAFLTLCDYAPNCSKGDKCNRAHNKEELANWIRELVQTQRDFKPGFHRLQMCRIADEKFNGKGSCRKLFGCEYAHSVEELDSWQKELDSWKECRDSAGKLLQLCRNRQNCKNGEACKFAHNEKELERWKNEHQRKYLESESSIPERCTYTVPIPTCQLGTSCPYAHTDNEREELIEKLADYDTTIPRLVPRTAKLLPYTLCENHKNEKKSLKGVCVYGKHCKQAHTEEELEAWEAERRREDLKMPIVRPFRVGESRFTMCRAFSPACIRESCCYAHTEAELTEWIRISKLSMLGPVGDQASYSSDPFLASPTDYQRRFSDGLATVLTAVVTKTQKQDHKKKLKAFIDHNRTKIDLGTSEGQQCASLSDPQYLIGFMQRNLTVFSEQLHIEKLYLTGFLADLLEVRNALAHSLFQGEDDEAKGKKTRRLIQRGIEFVGKIARQGDASSYDDSADNDAIKRGYQELLRIQDSFRDYILYQTESSKKMAKYNSMTGEEQSAEAKKVLLRLLEEEIVPDHVTKFIATCMSARLCSH